MSDINDDLAVTYTVKELLSSIHDSVTVIDSKLDHKVDKSEFVGLEARVTLLERVKDKAMGAALVLATMGGGVGFVVKGILG